ncbi:MAG: PDZ domain-containing protein [Desulfurococcaceae archaeon]
MGGSKGWWKALHYSSVMGYNFFPMLALYPSLLVSFVLLLLLYSFLISGIKLSIPKLQREEVQTQSLFASFESLYPKEEKKEEESLPAVNLLATAVGSVRLALARVDGQTKTLRIGSQVGSYRVTAIERNYIVLSKGENKIAVGFRFGPEPPPQVSIGTAPFQTLPTPQASRSLQAVLPRGELERITADPGIMFRMIRLVPFVQGGRTRGFLFEWVEPGSIFDRAGIRPGDVLLSINNQEIRSGEDAFRILQVLRNESSIRLNLQRGNELIELFLRVE